jgi:hypothetical protein
MRLLALLLLAAPQDPKKEPTREQVLKKVDAKKVEAAIRKGVDHLYWRVDNNALRPFEYEKRTQRYDDLVLLTLVHAGADPADKRFQKVLQNCLEGPLETTYSVALQAMALQKLDAAKHQGRIAQCAQFLVETQAKSGAWGYGEKVALDEFKTKPPKKGTKALDRITLKKKGLGTAAFGDNSNTQYAAMGLRAAHEASIEIPWDTIKAAKEWWEKAQNDDGGWGYGSKGRDSYGSMTAGGMASLAIWDFFAGQAPRKDPNLAEARAWIAKEFDLAKNPGFTMNPKDDHRYYWLYALERAGTLFGTEVFGAHEWYPEGAKAILDEQKPNGSWNNYAADTCFAILFLRRATDDFRPPVATEDK